MLNVNGVDFQPCTYHSGPILQNWPKLRKLKRKHCWGGGGLRLMNLFIYFFFNLSDRAPFCESTSPKLTQKYGKRALLNVIITATVLPISHDCLPCYNHINFVQNSLGLIVIATATSMVDTSTSSRGGSRICKKGGPGG